MNIRNHAILGFLLTGAQVLSTGQNPPAQGNDASRSVPAPALSGVVGMDSPLPEEDTNGDVPQIPPMLGGPKMSLALRSESERSNYIRGGLNVGGTYDDNALLTPHNTLGNTTFSVFPNISIEQARSRMKWTLGYAAGLTVNERLSSRNQGSHDLNFDAQFRLSPHVNLRIAEDFSLTSGFFDSGNTGGVVGNGNVSLIQPLSKQRSSSTVAEANYHFALKDVIGASGSFSDLHFSDVPGNVSPGFNLTNTRTASGSAFWLHGLFGRDWAGVSYRFQRVTFDPNGETRVHSITAVDTIDLPGRFTISGFVGPEYSDNQGVDPASGLAIHFSDWSFAGGAEIGWQKEHTSVAAGYSRQISNGGGVLGAVQFQGVHGEVRQQLLPGWAVGVGASYGNNQSLTVPTAGTAGKINSATVAASLERNLGKSLGLRVGYEHDFQEQIGVADPNLQGTAHRNRFSVTLGYQWARPLGR